MKYLMIYLFLQLAREEKFRGIYTGPDDPNNKVADDPVQQLDMAAITDPCSPQMDDLNRQIDVMAAMEKQALHKSGIALANCDRSVSVCK